MFVTAASLRLAGILGRRRRREWAQWVRKAIVHLVVPLVCADEVRIAGSEPCGALGFLSDANSSAVVVKTKILSLIALIIINHWLVVNAVLNRLLLPLTCGPVPLKPPRAL